MVEMFVVEGLPEKELGCSPRVAVAPLCEEIKTGDLVIIEGEGQRFRRALTDSITIAKENDIIYMIKTLTGKDVMRAYGKYRLKEFNWEEGENE